MKFHFFQSFDYLTEYVFVMQKKNIQEEILVNSNMLSPRIPLQCLFFVPIHLVCYTWMYAYGSLFTVRFTAIGNGWELEGGESRGGKGETVSLHFVSRIRRFFLLLILLCFFKEPFQLSTPTHSSRLAIIPFRIVYTSHEVNWANVIF